MASKSKPRPDDAGARTSAQKYECIEIHRSKLANAPYNPRVLSDKARERLGAGLKKHGLLGPPTWNMRTGNIVSGHQRLAAIDAMSKSADYTLTVAVVDLDEKQEKEANILLNNAEAQGDWDIEKLSAMFEPGELDISATGFSTADIYRMFGDAPALTSQPSVMNEMSESIRAARENYDQMVQQRTKSSSTDFYIVVVFSDEDDRDSFLEAAGMDQNRFQDGRELRRLILGERQPPKAPE
jgi:hypothetical protein